MKEIRSLTVSKDNIRLSLTVSVAGLQIRVGFTWIQIRAPRINHTGSGSDPQKTNILININIKGNIIHILMPYTAINTDRKVEFLSDFKSSCSDRIRSKHR